MLIDYFFHTVKEDVNQWNFQIFICFENHFLWIKLNLSPSLYAEMLYIHICFQYKSQQIYLMNFKKFFFFFVSSHLSSSHAAIHLSDCGARPGSRRPVGLWPLYFCHLCGRSHDEDSPEAAEKPTVQTAGQPPALSAQHDSEVCWNMTSDSVCWCHRGLVMFAERHWAGQEVTVSCFQSTSNADGMQGSALSDLTVFHVDLVFIRALKYTSI